MPLILLALALASYALAAVFYSRYIPEQNISLILADSILLGLAVGMVYKLVSTFILKPLKNSEQMSFRVSETT